MVISRQSFLLVTALWLWSGVLQANQILQCTDKNGRKIFTDDPRICAARGGADSSAEPIELTRLNTHSQYGATISEEYRNYAFRAYSPVEGYSIPIMAEDALIEGAPDVLKKASKKLDRSMADAIRLYPPHIRAEFSNITYYLFTGHEANTGGRRGGQWYFRRGNSVSQRFDDSIVVRSASSYLKHPHETSVATGVHELAHAYHYYHWQTHARKILNAYQNALNARLYRNVRNKAGYSIAKAYALTKDREYFAELSKTYLYKNTTFPFTRLDLEQYDPVGYQLMREIYGN